MEVIYSVLSSFIYIVPLIAAAFIMLFAGTVITLSAFADIRCQICKRKFSNLYWFRRHMREGHKKKEEIDERYGKAA